MTNAGYVPSQYSIVVQDYMSPLPTASKMRYAEFGFGRQLTGGCGFWNKDLNWANQVALGTINDAVRTAVAESGLPNVKLLELATAFDGRRLCENTVGLLEEENIATFKSLGAVDHTERVEQIRTVSAAFDSPYFTVESLHPNFWGQLALRNCVRNALNNGVPRGGRCIRAVVNWLTAKGEPNMVLAP